MSPTKYKWTLTWLQAVILKGAVNGTIVSKLTVLQRGIEGTMMLNPTPNRQHCMSTYEGCSSAESVCPHAILRWIACWTY